MSGQVPGEFAAYSLAWAEEFDGPAGATASPQTWRPETMLIDYIRIYTA